MDASSWFESRIGSQLPVRDSNPELAAGCQFAIRRYFSHRLQNWSSLINTMWHRQSSTPCKIDPNHGLAANCTSVQTKWVRTKPILSAYVMHRQILCFSSVVQWKYVCMLSNEFTTRCQFAIRIPNWHLAASSLFANIFLTACILNLHFYTLCDIVKVQHYSHGQTMA